ncbi:MAG: homoserine dehydrogenase [Armatimonadetes bacterium]|nr:homoserine dehydrogenase [Armatimonadota bacterium]
MAKEVIRVGILGLGTVGSGTVQTLQENKKDIEQKIGARLEIKKIAVAHPDKKRPVPLEPGWITGDVNEVMDDPEIDIVAELIGGVEPARSYIDRALDSGKHIVTANKELLAKGGHELLTKAATHRLDFYFEGSVAGGIPIVQAMKIGLAANHIERVVGIVNGTTNYILTQMAQEGKDFAEALAEAQAKGYAEADPTNDVEGYDAAYKIAILASIAFMSRVDPEDIHAEGIARITAGDIRYARELGYAIKLLAIGRQENGSIQARVHPALLPFAHPLASVNDVFNAVFVRGSSVGEVMFFGRGAGALPTGSAVAADILEVARNIRFGSAGRIACTCFENKSVIPMDTIETKYYIRMKVSDKPKVLATIAGVFGEFGVSVESVVQKAVPTGESAEIVWVTHQALEKNVREALEVIARLPVVAEVSNWIRVEE